MNIGKSPINQAKGLDKQYSTKYENFSQDRTPLNTSHGNKYQTRNIFSSEQQYSDPMLEELRKKQLQQQITQKPKMQKIYKDIRTNRYIFPKRYNQDGDTQSKSRKCHSQTPQPSSVFNSGFSNSNSFNDKSGNESIDNNSSQGRSPIYNRQKQYCQNDEILKPNKQSHKKQNSYDTGGRQKYTANSVDRRNQTSEEFYKTQAQELYQLRKKVSKDYELDNEIEQLSPRSIQSKKNYRPLNNTQNNFRSKRQQQQQQENVNQRACSQNNNKITEQDNEEELDNNCILKNSDESFNNNEEEQENGENNNEGDIQEEGQNVCKIKRQQQDKSGKDKKEVDQKTKEQEEQQQELQDQQDQIQQQEHDQLNHIFSILLKPEYRDKFRTQLEIFIKDNPDFINHLQRKCACFSCNCGKCKCSQSKKVISKPSYQMLKTLYRTTFNPSKIKSILQIHPNIYEQKMDVYDRVGLNQTTSQYYHGVKEGDIVEDQKSEGFKVMKQEHKVNTDMKFNNLSSSYQFNFPKYPSYENYLIKRVQQTSVIDNLPFISKTTYTQSFKNGKITKKPKIYGKQGSSSSNEIQKPQINNLKRLEPPKSTSQEFFKPHPRQTDKPIKYRYIDNNPIPTGSPNYHGQYNTINTKDFRDHNIKAPSLDDCPVFQLNSNSNSMRNSMDRSFLLNSSQYSNFSGSSVKSGIKLQFRPISTN